MSDNNSNENGSEEDRPEEVDAFVDAFADYCKQADDSVEACETVNAYLFDVYAASRLTNHPEPDAPGGLEELAELPIGFDDVLTPDTIGRYFDLVVARLHNRSATGSFYTPGPIVEFIDQETIRPRVRDILEEDVGVDDLPDDNHDIPVEELAAACTPEQARAALDELASFSICDPACGSGQFLVQAVDDVAEIRQAFADRIDADVHHAAHVWAATHTVYGVDIVSETVRMARLRVKLRVVDALPAGAPEEVLEEDLPRIREGRHLEHQLKHGNSLIGITDMERLEDALSEDEPSGQTTLAGGDWA